MRQHSMALAGGVFIAVTWVVVLLSAGSTLVGILTQKRHWRQAGRYAAYAAMGVLTLCSILVLFALLSNDFSIRYVYHHSAAAMPWYYKLTAYWGGLDGSLLFWAWLLSVLSCLAIHWNRHRHPDLIPWVTVILMVLLSFFVGLLVFYKPPFAPFLLSPPLDGKGLNPLLQDPYMATHPPSLYIGYVSASIPFAFGLAALITGQLDENWLSSVRRWMLLCWYFLSQGLILGALWAYHVLGWGGYWGWDPVENAGLLPWFTASAFLHSIMIQERRGMLKTWNLILVSLTFLLTLVGTFLTRTGVVQSVHAFGEDSTLGVAFLSVIAVTALVSFGFLVYRLPRLRGKGELESYLSREFAFVLNNWVLVGATLFVLVATLFPLISKTFSGTSFQVGPPFFHRWMGPIGLVLLLLTGAGPLMAWRRSSVVKFLHTFAIPVVVCGVVVTVLALFFPATRVRSHFLSESVRIPTSLICFGLVAFVLSSLLQEWIRAAWARHRSTGAGLLGSSIDVVLKNHRKYGGYLVHAGIALMFFGFAGQPYAHEEFALFDHPGQTRSIGRYQIRYDGYHVTSTAQIEKQEEIRLRIFVGGEEIGTMHPAKWTYQGRSDEPPRTVVRIRSSLRDDLYIVFLGYDTASNQASIKVMINPLVTWIWIGFALLILGTALAFLPDRLKKQAAVVAIGLFLVLHPHTALAQTAHQPSAIEMPVSPPKTEQEQRLRQKLVCMCGGCGRQTLAECTCGHAVKQRADLTHFLQNPRTDAEAVQFFAAQYPGQSVLVEPPRTGWYQLLWIAPLLLSVAVGMGLARKMKSRGSPATPPTTSLPTSSIEKYAHQLDRDVKEDM